MSYGWTIGSKLEEMSYICEISQTEAYKLTLDKRGFGKIDFSIILFKKKTQNTKKKKKLQKIPSTVGMRGFKDQFRILSGVSLTTDRPKKIKK